MLPSVIEIVQNTDRTIEGQVTDTQDGKPLDITGWTIQLTVKRHRHDPEAPLLIKSTATGGGITVTDAASGKLEIKFDATDTANLAGDYAHEVTRTDAGNRERIEYGRFRVLKSMTP